MHVQFSLCRWGEEAGNEATVTALFIVPYRVHVISGGEVYTYGVKACVPMYMHIHCIINPRRACAARVTVVNPRRACAARVTVVGSVCVSVC